MKTETGFRFGCASVRSLEQGAELLWIGNWSGAPRRTVRNAEGDVVPASHQQLVRPGEWARVRWNVRLTCIDTGAWWYEATTVNFAVRTPSKIPTDLFLTTPPAAAYEQMAWLR